MRRIVLQSQQVKPAFQESASKKLVGVTSTPINRLVSCEQAREGQTMYATMTASMKVEPVGSLCLRDGDTNINCLRADAICTFSEVGESILDIDCCCWHQCNISSQNHSRITRLNGCKTILAVRVS